MLTLLAALSWAGDPVLGPTGWLELGPVPDAADGARGAVVFDERCGVHVEVVDLDGGPYHHDVRLARVWDGAEWRWSDDWRVVGGRLERPGYAPALLDGLRFGEERLDVDGEGRVVRRSRAGRVLDVLRAPNGAFVGMRRGPVSVRVEDDEGIASDGRRVRWRREAGELRSVAGAGGVRVVYGYREGALARLDWPDGAAVAWEREGVAGVPGARTVTRGLGGAWRCEIRSLGKLGITSPAGTWLVARDGSGVAVTDPTGGVTRSRWSDGRLLGWTDPRGGETRLGRDARGRIIEVSEPTGATWRLAWDEGNLAALSGPDGARWTLTRGGGGTLVSFEEPTGRGSRWSWDRLGTLQEVRVGGSAWTFARDKAGRPVRLADPTGSAVDLARRDDGRVVRVRDAGGGDWALTHDGRGEVVALRAPGGATWSIARDALGRVVGVTDPAGAATTWTLRDDGLPGRLRVSSRHVWELLWSASGALSGLRDPAGRVTGWTRDGLGRARAVHRSDGATLRIDRDPAGDVAGVGDAVRVRRDASGRPLSIEALGLAWDRDVAGRVVGVGGPGIGLSLAREPGGAVREVRIGGETAVRLVRDAQGAVVRAEGDPSTPAVAIARDAAGRIVGIDGPHGRLTATRDARGLVARLEWSDRAWVHGRDGAGRLVVVAAGALRVGIDHDAAGRVVLARLPGGQLARFSLGDDERRVEVVDVDGRPLASLAWAFDPAGALARLRVGVDWLLRRDPLGALVVAESAERVWSNAPDGVDGPGGANIRYDTRGRPATVRAPEGPAPWSLVGELRYDVDEVGRIVAISGANGRVRLRYDGLGRLAGWRGPEGDHTLRRDALGRLVESGGRALMGWGQLLARGDEVHVGIPGVVQARAADGLLLGPDGAPLLSTRSGLLSWSPQGVPAAAGAAVGGRHADAPGLPALGLVDAIDPASGQPLGAAPRLPWAARAWEPSAGVSPFADPDAASPAPWDDAPWAPDSPWSDPLRLLVLAGELPEGGPRAANAPGLPWLPASSAPDLPAPLPDRSAFFHDDEPIVRWILDHARAPTRTPRDADVAEFFLSEALDGRLRGPPGLAPGLPVELGG